MSTVGWHNTRLRLLLSSRDKEGAFKEVFDQVQKEGGREGGGEGQEKCHDRRSQYAGFSASYFLPFLPFSLPPSSS